MRLNERFFVSDALLPLKDKVKKRVMKNRSNKDYYYITLPAGERDMLDIISARKTDVHEQFYDEMIVVGVAEDKDEAVKLAATIASGIYQETGEFDTRKYFGYR